MLEYSHLARKVLSSNNFLQSDHNLFIISVHFVFKYSYLNVHVGYLVNFMPCKYLYYVRALSRAALKGISSNGMNGSLLISCIFDDF